VVKIWFGGEGQQDHRILESLMAQRACARMSALAHTEFEAERNGLGALALGVAAGVVCI
jgi:hypothetical protein